MTPGVFVAIVGPSGVGKDTLIGEARTRLGDNPDFHFVRRLVTRPANDYEDHDSLSEEEFLTGVTRNAFALAWRAHGFGYAVPQNIRAAVDNGVVAVCNLSRGAIDEARRIFPRVAAIVVTATNQTLLTRLATRGRESREAIAERLDREARLTPNLIPDYTIANDGPPEAGGRQLVRILEGLRLTVPDAV